MNLIKSLLALIAFVLACFAGTAQAQTTVRMLAGFPPGGDLDTVARVFAEKLGEAIGRPVVVETRSGAAGRIAALALKSSAPDGNTLMMVPEVALTLYPHTVKKPVYDTFKDFVPVAHAGSYENALAITASDSAKDFREWVSRAKTERKDVAYGSPGAGSAMHMFGWMLAQATGVRLVHVPYRGVAPALADLAGGQIPAAVLTLAPLAQQAKAGKIRLLAHSGSRRSSVASEVPTFKELGYPVLEILGWYCIIAPAGIRPELVARYNEFVNQAQRSAAVRDRLGALGLEFHEMAPAEIAAKVKAEYDRWGPIVKASGFSADDQ